MLYKDEYNILVVLFVLNAVYIYKGYIIRI